MGLGQREEKPGCEVVDGGRGGETCRVEDSSISSSSGAEQAGWILLGWCLVGESVEATVGVLTEVRDQVLW